MKRILLTIVVAALMAMCFGVADNQSAATTFRVISSNAQQLRLGVTLPLMEISEVEQNGRTVKKLTADDEFATAYLGMPELPLISSMIAIPPQGSYTLSYTYDNIEIIPMDNPRLYTGENDDPDPDYTPYTQNLFPATPVLGATPSILRDFRVVQLTVYPYQYDLENQELRIYHNLQVTLNFNNEPGVNEMPEYTTYSSAFANIYEAQIANFADYRNLLIAPAQPRVLLIHGNSTDATFITKLNEFVTWKRQKGFEMNVVNVQQAGGSSNTSIKNYIQAQYNNAATKPDYVILLGDTSGSYAIPTWYESLSGYNGEGDYPYTHLAGGDILGDVLLGRISAENISQLTTLFSKIYTYEKNINIAGDAAAWLNRMLLIGDPSSSGMSCVYVNKYVHELSASINPDYSYIENYTGGYSSTMNSGISQGVGFFNYRGYIGMSGWSPSSSLTNGPRLPHAVILTCGTGTFGGGTSTTEEFIRLGTEAAPKGALTAMGMATTGTHTMFNNALSMGIFSGILVHKMRTMGEALLNGKLFLWNLYGVTNPSQANYFAHWCNLMGDPTVEAFVGIPTNMNIVASDAIPLGTSYMDVLVRDDQQTPIAEASVTIYSAAAGNVVAKGFTDAQGMVTLFIPSSVTSEIIITSSKHDCKPAQKTVAMDQAGSLVFFEKSFVDNGSSGSIGNSDGFINAGETIALWVELKNTTAADISITSASITSPDGMINIVQGTTTFPAIIPSTTGVSVTPILFTMDNNIPAFRDCRFVLNLTDSNNTTYQLVFHLGAYNANLVVSNYGISAGGNSILDPAENGILTLNATNNSVFGATDVYGQLTSLNDLIVVTDSLAFFGNIPAGMTINSVDSYGLFARPLLIPGMSVPFRLRLFNSVGFEQLAYFNLPVGTVSQQTPLGPDEYGYFIYDISDTSYPDCPTYQWIEINPSSGGSGTLITGLSDTGDSSDEGDQQGSDVLEVVDLPFTFPFYGVEYNQITVCVNGFIAMGVTGNGEFRNGRLPGGHGPAPLIAPFWDDLIILSGGGIYRYYDTAQHLFIIQYNNLKNGYNRTSEETFQVIFYDPMFYPTSMVDGMIKIQYKIFNNVDVGGGGYAPRHGNYCTVGIRDASHTRGLEYTFNNQYPQAAQPLGNNKALLITTVPILHQNAHLVVGEMILNDANGNSYLEPGETAEIGLKLNNLGLNPATSVVMSASSTSPFVVIQNSQSAYPDIQGSGSAVNIQPITLTASLDAPNEAVVELEFLVTIDGNTWTYSMTTAIKKPAITITGIYLNDLQGNGNGLADPNETFNMIVYYNNPSNVDASNLTSNVTCLNEDVTIENPQQLIPLIPAGDTMQAVYEVTLSSDVIVGNNITFYLTYLGDQIDAHNEQLLLNVGTTGMMTDFETDNGSFTASPTTGWQWGTDNTAGAHSGVKVWGTLLNQQYPNNVNWTLTSPSVFVGSNFVLEFWQNFETELNYDGGNVKISTNNGSSWTLLYPENGYTQDNVAALNGPGFAGNSTGWQQARFNLGAYSNQNVRFRWTFAADNMIQGQGWFIDDVQTTGFVPFAGKMNGVVTSSNPDIDFSQVVIKNAQSLATQPDDDGNYVLYLPAGSHNVSAAAPGYNTDSVFPITLNVTNPAVTHDFSLGYFSPVTNLAWDVDQDSLSLTWNAPVEPLYEVVSYKVFRKINAGAYEQMGVYFDTIYVESLSLEGTYSYYVVAVYADGESVGLDPVQFDFPVVPGDDPITPPMATNLYQNYPNPFNPSTTISFDLAKNEPVKITVYNIKGQEVKTLLNGNLPAGKHQLVWDGNDRNARKVASGMYFIRMESRSYNATRKAILMK